MNSTGEGKDHRLKVYGVTLRVPVITTRHVHTMGKFHKHILRTILS
mgnify:CR=1 FL=1